MTSNNYVDKIISPFIPSQFPQFYEERGPNFIAFVQAYYQWLEQHTDNYVGSTTYQARSLLEHLDVDTTMDKFVKFFSDEFLLNFPQNLAIDHGFIIKHILDFYRTKGTERGIELLFRILYNLDTKVNIPGKQMFRTSNATWKIPRYIETTDSQYLSQLSGHIIRNSAGATAVVETVNQKIINNRFVNIIYLSSMTDDFKNGDLIFCDAFPDMVNDAPLVIGSLTTVSINNGGADFKVGDEVQINGTGSDGLARVAAVVSENGKVSFQLVDGGYGFSIGASVTIDNAGTGGTDASFQIGSITDVQNISLNIDAIDGIRATQMDLSTEGLTVLVNNTNLTFQNGELVSGYAWTRNLQVSTILAPSGYIANGEALANSTLGIANVVVYISDGQQLYCTGNSTVLNNANLVAGTVLVSNTTGATVKIVSAFSPVVNTFANGMYLSAGSNSTVLVMHRADADDIGYYVTGMNIAGSTSGATATVVNETRLTDWQYFPVASFGSSLDSTLAGSFSVINKQIGRIAYLKNENPGEGYVTPPSVSLVEPLIYDLRIHDGRGGYWGDDAIVTATAGSANGIATAVTIVDSGFGYQPNESVILNDPNNVTAIYGKAVVRASGFGKGHWLDTQSFLSDTMVLQDSYYYQVFSYEIATEKMIDTYRELVKELVHPVGYALFGKFDVEREFPKSGGHLISSSVSTRGLSGGNIENEDYYDIMTEANGDILIDGTYAVNVIVGGTGIFPESPNYLVTPDGSYVSTPDGDFIVLP